MPLFLTYVCTRSVDRQMDAVFSVWDLVMLPLSRHCTMFLTTFVEEAVRILVSSSTSDKNAPDPYHAGVFKWLERILSSSRTWTATRKQYLVLSYVQAMCSERSGYWTERLRPLLGDLPTRVEDSSEDQGVDKTANGKADAANECSKLDNLEENADLAALRDYGWTVSEMRSSKPIGIV